MPWVQLHCCTCSPFPCCLRTRFEQATCAFHARATAAAKDLASVTSIVDATGAATAADSTVKNAESENAPAPVTVPGDTTDAIDVADTGMNSQPMLLQSMSS